MTYRVRIPEQADADLRGIYEYIAFHLCSVQNAARQLERLEKAVYGLDTRFEYDFAVRVAESEFYLQQANA